MIKDITEKLYSDSPRETLYHYTNFSGLLGIVSSRCLWASDIRYMNDSAELKHTARLIQQAVSRRLAEGHPHPKLLNQFVEWVSNRITNGHILFGASFRSNGNLLSQWRGYSTHGKGVSVGFAAGHLSRWADRQCFQIGRCIYDHIYQENLINEILDAVERLAEDSDESPPAEQREPFQFYHRVFQKIEIDLLKIAAILKHPSFEEEDEWRILSPVITDYVASPVKFREGSSMLVPFWEFNLRDDDTAPIYIKHIYLGPTVNIEQSMNSLRMFLSKQGITPTDGIDYCQIPYRQQQAWGKS